jgi:SEC-C motif
MVGDRMLSRAQTPTDPDANKLGVLLCRGSRWAVGLSGLASIARGGAVYFRTHQFVAEALADVAEPDHFGMPVIERFAAKLVDRFDQADARAYGLSVVFMGFQEAAPGVSDLTRRVFFARTSPPIEIQVAGALVTAIGETRAVDQALLQRLADMAAGGASPTGLRDLAVHIIRTAAETAIGRGVIGPKCASMVVPSNPAVDCGLDYLTDKPTKVRRYGNVVDCRGVGPGIVFTDYSFESFGDHPDDLKNVTVQKVGRNDPCPCGSGKKFKRCHYQIQTQEPQRYEMLVRFQYRPGMTLTLPIPNKGQSEVRLPKS